MQRRRRVIKPDFYYYNESEWSRLGCGPLPEERRRPQPQTQTEDVYYVYPEEDGYDRPRNPYGQH